MVELLFHQVVITITHLHHPILFTQAFLLVPQKQLVA
jgi:hypothetical protein